MTFTNDTEFRDLRKQQTICSTWSLSVIRIEVESLIVFKTGIEWRGRRKRVSRLYSGRCLFSLREGALVELCCRWPPICYCCSHIDNGDCKIDKALCLFRFDFRTYLNLDHIKFDWELLLRGTFSNLTWVDFLNCNQSIQNSAARNPALSEINEALFFYWWLVSAISDTKCLVFRHHNWLAFNVNCSNKNCTLNNKKIFPSLSVFLSLSLF